MISLVLVNLLLTYLNNLVFFLSSNLTITYLVVSSFFEQRTTRVLVVCTLWISLGQVLHTHSLLFIDSLGCTNELWWFRNCMSLRVWIISWRDYKPIWILRWLTNKLTGKRSYLDVVWCLLRFVLLLGALLAPFFLGDVF